MGQQANQDWESDKEAPNHLVRIIEKHRRDESSLKLGVIVEIEI